MPIFRCDKCGCVENSATSNYWEQKHPFGGGYETAKLCSECDPEIGQWHGRFPKNSAKGLILADDGFLYDKEEIPDFKRMGITVVKEIE